jgi:tRNA modification GTPase
MGTDGRRGNAGVEAIGRPDDLDRHHYPADVIGSLSEETIFALSSGAPPAAIAVVRISGPQAGLALQSLAGQLPEPRHASLRSLRSADGALLDKALILWFPGPATATGEDLAELHLHGGRAVVAAVMKALGALADCRLAEPGEFTRRAFANGRLDLAEAEGLADLLTAETEIGRRQALRLADGGLSRLAEEWRDQLLQLSARAEAQLQFGDDEGDVLPDDRLAGDIADLRDCFQDLLKHPPAERLLSGFRVVIAGPTNAGKSSLINTIAGREAAIESPLAGTTRDLIEVPVSLSGLPMILIDSAGLRDSDEPIESIGIERARQAISQADLTLWLGEPADAPAQALIVHPRADLPGRHLQPMGAEITISTVSGEGLDELQRIIVDRLKSKMPPDNMILLNERHRNLVAQAAELLDVEDGDLPELVAEQLRLALNQVERITGRAGVEDMLDTLFGRFCLGK